MFSNTSKKLYSLQRYSEPDQKCNYTHCSWSNVYKRSKSPWQDRIFQHQLFIISYRWNSMAGLQKSNTNVKPSAAAKAGLMADLTLCGTGPTLNTCWNVARYKGSLIRYFFSFLLCFFSFCLTHTHTIILPSLSTSLHRQDCMPPQFTPHSPSRRHSHFPTHSVHCTNADAFSSPDTGVPYKPEENGRHGTPLTGGLPSTTNQEWGMSKSKHITAAILADGGRRGRGKDEGRTGGPWCEHRPTEHSPTCGVN